MADKVVISDLLTVIHYTIIKKLGENSIILEELSAIDKKIQSGELEDFKVEGIPFWETIKTMINENR